MRTLILLLASLPIWALSNAVVLQEQSGATQNNRVITIPRWFAADEICQYPQPYVFGGAVANWQADIKTRFPASASCSGGSVKFALITIEITLSANSNTSVDFRSSSSSSSSGSGLSQAQTLAFNTGGGAGSWGAGWTATTGGVTITCRVGSAIPCGARDMIAAGFYKVLESGPLRTGVLVREGPDDVTPVTTRTTSVGWQCNSGAGCLAPYAGLSWVAGTGLYRSIRPSYVVTFYTSPTGGISNNRVETDYLLDNGWLDGAQDQRLESLELDTGASESTACYTAPAAFVIPFRSRMFETCWQAGAPGAVNIDFNRAYMMYTKVTPAFGLNWVVGEASIAAELGTGPSTVCTVSGTCSFLSSDQGATTNATIAPEMGWGQDFDHGGATGGGSPINGWSPRWVARYLLTFDARMLAVTLGNAKAYMHAPIFPLENSTTAMFQTGGSVKAFGRTVSIDVRTTYNSFDGATGMDAPLAPSGSYPCNSSFTACAGGYGSGVSTCVAPACMITCEYKSSAMFNFCSVYTYGANHVNDWGMDPAHSREMFFVAYLCTGKLVYLEGEQAMAGWALLAPPINSRDGNLALIFDGGNLIRGTVEPLRLIGLTAAISPDGSTEQAYFTQKLNNNLAAQEGFYGVTDGNFAPSDPTCPNHTATQADAWHFGFCSVNQGWSNPLGFSSAPHGQVTDGSLSYNCGGCVGALANDGVAPWMEGYATNYFGHLRDLGFPAAFVHAAAAKHTMGMWADSQFGMAFPGQAGVIEYSMPALAPTVPAYEPGAVRTGWLQSWAAVKAAHIEGSVLSLPIGASDTTLYTPPFFDSGSEPTMGVYDAGNKGATYIKVENEIMLWGQLLNAGAAISAVSTSLNQVTATAHGLTNGEFVYLYANPGSLDNAMIGGTNCTLLSYGWTNLCTLYAGVVDANTLRFYTDAALTSPVVLSGGSSNMAVQVGRMTPLTRGALGTVPAAHAEGTPWTYWSIITPGGRVYEPDAHAFFYTSALATAADYGLSVVDSGTGKTISAQRAFDLTNQVVWNQQMAGANLATCPNVMTCDNPTWSQAPRPLIRNVRLNIGSTSTTLYYSPPDGNSCMIGLSTTPFASSDDSGDLADSSVMLSRAYTLTTTGTTSYYYRISCGPSGRSARVSGSFTTN